MYNFECIVHHVKLVIMQMLHATLFLYSQSCVAIVCVHVRSLVDSVQSQVMRFGGFNVSSKCCLVVYTHYYTDTHSSKSVFKGHQLLVEAVTLLQIVNDSPLGIYSKSFLPNWTMLSHILNGLKGGL